MKSVRVTRGGAAFLVVSILSVAVALLAQDGNVKEATRSWGWFSPKSLDLLEVHLPSYMSSLQAQLDYQAKNPMHQEIVLQWLSDGRETKGANGGFRLTRHWQHMPGGAAIGQLTPSNPQLLVIATTSDREVRALSLCPDDRSTSGTLDILLPQDGLISKVILARDLASSKIEFVGEADLKSPVLVGAP